MRDHGERHRPRATARRGWSAWVLPSILAAALLPGLLASGGCRRRAHSPEEALARLQNVVAKRDPAALFDVLDQRSRWAWMTIQKTHREAYDIILSNYPEGPERDRELRRFQKGAMLGSARALFAEEVGQAALGALASPLAPVERFEPAPAGAAPASQPGPRPAAEAPAPASSSPAAEPPDQTSVAVLTDGTRLAFERGPDGSWGYAAFAHASNERQNRALHDVELVRASAADYERAALRGGR